MHIHAPSSFHKCSLGKIVYRVDPNLLTVIELPAYVRGEFLEPLPWELWRKLHVVPLDTPNLEF